MKDYTHVHIRFSALKCCCVMNIFHKNLIFRFNKKEGFINMFEKKASVF